jgi:hypothetical protein
MPLPQQMAAGKNQLDLLSIGRSNPVIIAGTVADTRFHYV